MKIDIITFHFVSNAGGILQCLALQHFLQSQGFDVNVIDYRPPYHAVRYNTVKNPFVFSRRYWRQFRHQKPLKRIYKTLRGFARCIRLNIRQPDKKKAELFSSFIEKYLHLTKRYSSIKQLRSDPPKADAYITGSDQLWNPDLLDFCFDPAYFLDFGDESIPRISYAVSTGKVLSEAENQELHGLCKKLTAVSLREYREETVDAIGQDVHITIDPTLLLTKEAYSAYEAQSSIEEPYIFVYGFENTEGIHRAIDLAEKKYHCKIVNGSPHRIHVNGNVQNILDIGPDQFLTLVKNAKCVVTNSFHGTAFSVIYQKDFISVAHSTRGNRMTQLLKKLGLEYRLFGDHSFCFEGLPDFASAEKMLFSLREHSVEFLLEGIQGAKGAQIPHYDDEVFEESKAEEEPREEKAFYGYYLSRDKLLRCASGGAASALSEMIIEKGGVVFGVEYAEDFRSARYACAESLEQLARFASSKYVFPMLKCSNSNHVFETVEEKLCEGRTVLFIGLGCIVGGLLNRLERRGIDTEHLYTVDLICHGPVQEAVQLKYIEELEKKYQSSIVHFETRYKKYGWGIAFVRAEFNNGKVYTKQLYDTDLGFALKYICREGCYHCRYKGDSHAADITVGDFWGLRPGMPEYNRDGVSVLFHRNEKGEALLKELDGNRFYCGKANASYAIKHNPMYNSSASKPSFYDKFEADIRENSLHFAVKQSPGYKRFLKASVLRRIRMLKKQK